MARKKRELPPDVYNDALFGSKVCEGFEEYKRGELSPTKAKEVDLLQVTPGIRVLEIGFGRGEVLRACAKAGAAITGIDYSECAFRIARETLAESPEADLRIADCRSLPFDADAFDRVFAADVIEHLCQEDGVQMLREMHRVLRPGGLLLVHTAPNAVFSNFLYPLLRPFIGMIDAGVVAEMEVQRDLARRLHIHEYNLLSLRKAARAAGLHQPEVWIDEDLMREATHRFTQPLARNRFVGFLAARGRNPLVRFFFGNDLYIRSTK